MLRVLLLKVKIVKKRVPLRKRPIRSGSASATLLVIAAAVTLAFLAAFIFMLASAAQMLAIMCTVAALLVMAAAIAFAFLAELILVLATPPQAFAMFPVLNGKDAGFKSRIAARIGVHNWGCEACARCHQHHGRAAAITLIAFHITAPLHEEGFLKTQELPQPIRVHASPRRLDMRARMKRESRHWHLSTGKTTD
jgi:hypothetical protein